MFIYHINIACLTHLLVSAVFKEKYNLGRVRKLLDEYFPDDLVSRYQENSGDVDLGSVLNNTNANAGDIGITDFIGGGSIYAGSGSGSGGNPSPTSPVTTPVLEDSSGPAPTETPVDPSSSPPTPPVDQISPTSCE